MHRISIVVGVALVAIVAGCSAPAGGSVSTGPSSPASTTEASSAPTAAITRIEVTLTDSLTIEPAQITVPSGVPVTFVVTNAGVLDHEFYLGDEEAQAAHAAEMAEMGGMAHDEPEGIGVEPGETKELTYTFEAPGQTLAGCHVQGHYLAGMKAEITIE